jgi:hypothetical protein
MTTKLALVLALTACVDLESEDSLADLEQESHSTSVATLPNRIVLAKLEKADIAATSVLQYSDSSPLLPLRDQPARRR